MARETAKRTETARRRKDAEQFAALLLPLVCQLSAKWEVERPRAIEGAQTRRRYEFVLASCTHC